ncbi:MAG: hypothetical protein HYV93_13910 [Candidatus Rokubacteria bacterium]|nr:hypothetical protein [Candidatus Rokubacteria bacterium]
MRVGTVARIALRAGPRERYWALRRHISRLAFLGQPRRRPFARVLARDYLRFALGAARPVRGEGRQRAEAAVGWLLRAQSVTPDDGVSLGYFPCLPDTTAGWLPSYPETTGYIIPSLLEFAEVFGRDDVRQRALRMAAWEIQVQMPSGAVQGGTVCAPDRQVPAVFNTGMVLHGYTAAYRATGETGFLEAGRRAADFLVADLDGDGHFRSHGTFVAQHRIKTYNCLCGWALWRFAEDSGDDRYAKVALRAAEAAAGQQHPNGWFANNCLTDPEAPLTHTIGYTLQGLLEIGLLAGRQDLVDAVRSGLAPLIGRISRGGFLHGCFFSNWEPATFSSCLTGSAQLAVVCLRLSQQTSEPGYRTAADRLLDHLKAHQLLGSPDPALDGAIGGSFPLLGSYMTAGYPNWATKYLLDGLLLQERLGPNSGT